MNIRLSTELATIDVCRERYVCDGYHDEMSSEKKLEIISKIKEITGLMIIYPDGGTPNDPDKLLKKLKNYNLKVADLWIDNSSERKWRYGAFSTNEAKIRKESIKLFKEGIDFAKEIKANSVLLWPAHDGFDYPFQVDYWDGWKNITETFQEIGEYDRSVKIAVEYKQKDPRQKKYISNVGKLLMLIQDIGLNNIGAALDLGHAFMSQENIAETLVILDSHKKLFQIHLDDNYKDADPDMMFGTINFWEALEFFYYLNKINFDGWLDTYVFAPRDDNIKSIETSAKMVWKYKKLVEKLEKYSDEIDRNLKEYHFAENISMISDIIF